MSDSLTQLATQLTRSIVPIIMFIGIIGNSLNIAVLTRPSLYFHACSRYFLVLAGNNLFYTSVMLIYQLLADGYQLDLANSSLISCKLVTYISHLSAVLSPYFIVLASMDRYCASSTNVRLRNLSNVKVTRWVILFVMVIIMLFYMNTPILIDLQPNDGYGCNIRGDMIYKQVYIIMQVILFAIIIPFLMTIFGIMTIQNIKAVRIIPTTVSRHRRTETQLIFMLLIQVGTHIVLSVPACVIYLMFILPITIPNPPVFYFVNMISQLFFNFSFATPFILYVASARAYRKELIRLIYKILRLRGANLVHPSTNTIINTVIPMNTTTRKRTTTIE